MALPRITVVTPSFNQGRFLEECIHSILDQKYPNLQYIILDGGSKDESVELIRKYEAHLDYWVSEKDNGQSDAINRGFRRANGDLVAWLNSDDYYLPGSLQAMAEAYQANPDASFYMGNGLRVNEQGQTITRYFPSGEVRYNHDALRFGICYVLQPSTFISRRHLQQVGDLDVSLNWGMDYDLWLRLATVGAPTALQADIAATREYGETKTSTGWFTRVEELRRIGLKHGQMLATPGALLCYLDTFYQTACEHPDVYPDTFLAELVHFRALAAKRLVPFGAGENGHPFTAQAPPRRDRGQRTIAGKIARRLRFVAWHVGRYLRHVEID